MTVSEIERHDVRVDDKIGGATVALAFRLTVGGADDDVSGTDAETVAKAEGFDISLEAAFTVEIAPGGADQNFLTQKDRAADTKTREFPALDAARQRTIMRDADGVVGHAGGTGGLRGERSSGRQEGNRE